MTTTLTLEVEEDILARAEARAKESGFDIKKELVRRITDLASDRQNRQLAAVRRLIELADQEPAYLTDGMPSREERNAR